MKTSKWNPSEAELNDIITSYSKGESLYSIAKRYSKFRSAVSNLLTKAGVELRHDDRSDKAYSDTMVKKMIEWAKTQDRLVTKTELAEAVGLKRLSVGYLTKYPELGQYVQVSKQQELNVYADYLYDWLQSNNIPYKPNDRTKLGVVVDALLFEEYSDIALQIDIKPRCLSKNNYEKRKKAKEENAKKYGVHLIFLNKYDFDNNLETIRDTLTSLKK